MDDQSLHRYTVTQIRKHTYKLDDTITDQTWEIEILRENYADILESIREQKLPKVTD